MYVANTVPVVVRLMSVRAVEVPADTFDGLKKAIDEDQPERLRELMDQCVSISVLFAYQSRFMYTLCPMILHCIPAMIPTATLIRGRTFHMRTGAREMVYGMLIFVRACAHVSSWLTWAPFQPCMQSPDFDAIPICDHLFCSVD